MLDVVESYYCMQFQRKLIKQTCENGKKPSLGPNLGRRNFFFSKTWPRQSLDVTISEKTNDPILKKLIDKRMDGQTDESDFIRRCPTNVECPIQTLRGNNSRILRDKNAKFSGYYFCMT